MDHDGEINRDRYHSHSHLQTKTRGLFYQVFREAYYPQNLTLSATAEKPKPKTPQIAAQKLGLGFYNGKIRSQTAPQREEILVRFYSHCLGCCSSENTRPIDLKLHSDVLAVECAKFDHPVGNNQEGSSAAAAQKSTANGDRYASDPMLVRYAKISMQLKDKIVRDVALRCRWMNDLDIICGLLLLNSFLISKDSPVVEPVRIHNGAEENKGALRKSRGEEDEAFQILEYQAQKGNAGAMYKIGLFYYFELRGLRRDRAKALSWFSKAADKGEAQSMEFLAEIYVRGAGVERNYTNQGSSNC
ncbi:hypothetical protein Q3G72_013704 [Acer saccharum]|nr:hypothetical protein Q3G72_013704 [Acer saccharum]